MKRKIAAFILCIVMIFTLAACGGSTPAGPVDSVGAVSLTFGTGGEQGTYYGYGSVLSQFVSTRTNVSMTAVSSGGSKSNIEDMDAGDVQLGFVQSDVMSYAYTGTSLFTDKIGSFSTVAALYKEQVQIVTLNPDIKSIADLEGKIVSIGDLGSGVYFNALDILGIYDLSESDITAVYQGFGDSVESLKDKKIDAAFIVAGAPTSAISSLAATNDVFLVSLDEQHIADLIALSPYYSAYTIPADVYGTPEDCATVAVGAVIIVRDDVPEAAVYDIVATIFGNIEDITQAHGKGTELDLQFASSITDVPYHPGAAKYFAENNIVVPTK